MSVQKSQINTTLTAFLGGNSMDTTLFDTLLQMQKNLRESSRDWMILRTLDTSIVFTSADDYTAGKTLPARFIRTYRANYRDQNDTGVYLVDAAGGINMLQPIQLSQRFQYKDVSGYYYIDVKNQTIGRTGNMAGTLHLNFIQGTVDISDATPWVFPDYASTLLAYDIAIQQKGGIDWDIVASFSVGMNESTIKQLQSALAMWDANLQQQALGV